MMPADYLLGIDNGGTVTKAAVYDTSGNEKAVAGIKSAIVFPRPGHAEKDTEALWAANVHVIREVLEKAGIGAAQVAGIAVTGHGNGMYLVDGKGRSVYNGINSADTRASDYVQKWYADGTHDRLLTRTCQSIWPGQPVALLAWFQDREPEVLERTRWVFMCKDFIRYRLTGEALAELTDYSGTSLLNVRTLDYDLELLESFGIGFCREKLPSLRRSAEICGRISRKAAEETGLLEGTPVAGGLFDISACAIASGIIDPAQLCLIAGSWSINEYISTSPVEAKDLFMTSAYCLPGHWLTMEGSATSASNLEWVVSELMGGESLGAGGQSIYNTCGELAASVHPADSDIVFLPFLYGSNVGPNAASCFLGLHGWHRKEHLLRAVFEGVVFSHKTHVDRLLTYRDTPKVARMAGGAAKSPIWVQMFADVLGIPIELTSNEELGAMGAAICAGVGVGVFASFEEAVDRMVCVSQTVEPRSDYTKLYADKYVRYQKYLRALAEAWA
ncbi:MAG: carbohydrate kinase [Spirochaetaceae bacterium]|nr:MAG: carbohydrate kinase [Spirochaetaceae bacterium]